MPEDAFNDDLETRKQIFLTDKEMYELLTEIDGMIGEPYVGVDLLQLQAPNQGTYNRYVKGKEALAEIVRETKAARLEGDYNVLS